MKLSYAFDRPSYPILCEVPGDLLWAQTRQQLERRLGNVEMPGVERLRLVDANGRGWTLNLDQNVVVPSIDNRRLTKTELLDLFRGSAIGRRNGLPISEDAARKKRVPELILMIIEWLKADGRVGSAPLDNPKEQPSAGDVSMTAKQGQYAAFIYYYTKIHGAPPSEADMQRYFGVSAPSVHQMVVTLESKGLIERTPGKARSIRILVAREQLPDLE